MKTKVIVVAKTHKNQTIEGLDIPVGTYFRGHIDKLKTSGERLFLRHYGGIVDLEDPNNTWNHGLPSVKDYRPLLEVIISDE